MNDIPKQPKQMSAVKLALLAQRLRSDADDLQYLKSEPIAIIGMGCRFPGGANSPSAYWDLLINKKDAISEIPKDRWDVDAFYDPESNTPGKINTRWAGFLDQVDKFDAAFFGISPREARAMDPQQRLFLEVAYEALEDAGVTFKDLGSSQAGVFATSYHNDYAYLQHATPEQIDGHTITGVSHSIVPNRLSHFLNLHGPSVSIDTACSSSLVAIHLACQSLRNEECDMALSGGVNLIISPDVMISLSKVGFLSQDGRCRTFDASASGFARGEGCGVVILKRLSDALSNGDRILAVIRGSAVNQDGHSNVLTAPNGLAQQQLIRQALENAKLSPDQIGYIEAHGTGTPLGDPIEVEALAEVIGSRADHPSDPCVIASVKTNIGHLEAAAGIAGLIKVVLSMQHQAIPAHLHFAKLNPHISLEGTPFIIPTETHPWPAGSRGRFAGISSFGVGGTNAHVILEEAPRLPASNKVRVPSKHYLLPLSAHSPQALQNIAQSTEDFLGKQPGQNLDDICYTASVRHNHHGQRLAVVATNSTELAASLRSFQSGKIQPDVATGGRRANHRQKLAFVFSGQGQQRWNMGRELLESEPVFRKVIEQCSTLLDQHADWSLLEELARSEESSRLDQTAIAQPAIFAIQVALAALWRSWGIIPDAVVGHSAGEIAAAHVANVLSLEDAVTIVFHRGRVMQQATGFGKMAAIEVPCSEAEQWITEYREHLSIAAVNSPFSTVISGQTDAVDAVLQSLQQAGIRTQVLPVNYAFHSQQMEPYKDLLIESLQGYVPNRATIPMYSTVTGTRIHGRELDAAYWARNMRETVNFSMAIESLLAEDHGIFLEISAHPALSGYLDQILRHQKKQGNILASLRGKKPEQKTMLRSLGELYTLGYEIDWKAIYPTGQVISLPAFPWQRKRHWIDAVQPGPKTRRQQAKGIHPLIGSRLRSPAIQGTVYESQISAAAPAFLGEHRILGTVILPATACIEMALAAIEDRFHATMALKDIVIQAAMPLSDLEQAVQLVMQSEEAKQGTFKLFSLPTDSEEWVLHASGSFADAAQHTRPADVNLAELQVQLLETISSEMHYETAFERGTEFGPGFQGVKRIWRNIQKRQALGQIELPDKLASELPHYRFHPALLDACLQVVIALLPSTPDTYLPIGLDGLHVFSHPDGQLWSYVQLHEDSDAKSEIKLADFQLIDGNGQIVAELIGLRLKKTTGEALSNVIGKRPGTAPSVGQYEVTWNPLPLDPILRSSQPENWLIFADQNGVGTKLAEVLRAQGNTCTLVERGPALQAVSENRWTVYPGSASDLAQLLASVLADDNQARRHIVYLWALDSDPAHAHQEQQEMVCGSALRLVQALLQTGNKIQPKLWLVTRGAQPVREDSVALTQAPLWGLGNTIALEHPEFGCVRIDLDPSPTADDSRGITSEFFSDTREDRIAFREGQRYVARLSEIRKPGRSTSSATDVDAVQAATLRIPASHTLDDLQLEPGIRRAPKAGEVEVQVHATGLNFRDILRVLGMYQVESSPLGNECVGRIVALGEGVKDLAIGDQVLAIATGSFGSFVTTPAKLVIRKPDHLSTEEAATIPMVFLTAHYAFNHLAKIKPGDKVLIHAAAGGVGLAAVQIALHAGAEIFGTAGNPEKREYLKSLGVHHVLDSRSLDFADQILQITGGDGVDIILNSLAGEFISKSFSVLRESGCFLEIGKTNILSAEQVAAIKPNASYFVIYLGEIFENDPALTQIMLQELVNKFEAHTFVPLPRKVFPIAEVREAFRFMAQAKHTGKIVVTRPEIPANGTRPAASIRPDATYLITGGTGGIGLVTARWLVERGARHIVLCSRTANADASQEMDELRQKSGANIVIVQGDISQRTDVARLLKEIGQTMPAVRGIFHAAGVVSDGVLSQQDWVHFTQVMNPKISGTLHLHELTQDMDLDFFVMYSSVASIFGSAGQGNYAAANAFLDAFAHYRRSKGLPALSVNWGSWKNLGMTARLDVRDQLRFEKQGMDGVTPEHGMKALQQILEEPSIAQAALLSIRWDVYARTTTSSFFSGLASEHRVRSTKESDKDSGFLQEYNKLPAARQQQMLRSFLSEQARLILGLDATESIDVNQSLRELGLDSLIAVELRNLLSASLKADLSATLLFDYPTITNLANYLFKEVLQKSHPTPGDMAGETHKKSTGSSPAPASTQINVQELSDEEAEALLLAELDDKDTKGAKK